MADWYVSSAAWTAVPQFAASTAYTVGQFVRPLTAPLIYAQFAFRCTTAGTSGTEPTWPTGDGVTVTTGGATFTNVSGRSAYGWSAPFGNLITFTPVGYVRVISAGDRIFVSSDHTETYSSGAIIYTFNASGYGVLQLISVNRAGSVPPAAVDIQSGASISVTSGTFALESNINTYWQGFTFTLGGTATSLYFANSGFKQLYFKNCSFVLSTSNTTAFIGSNDYGIKMTFDNTTVQFNNANQRLYSPYQLDLLWINTPTATLGTVPTTLFNGSSYQVSVTCRGVDLSAITSTLCYGASASNNFMKALFDSCRIASGVARLGSNTYVNAADEVELVNCFDGTNFVNERHTPAGDLNTEFTITMTSGATDNVGAFSHRMVSSTRSDKFAMTLDSFWMDVNLATIGGPRTATVEIVSSASLNADEIILVIEYLGTAGSSLASFANSFPNPLTTPTALATSSVAWNSLPATPVRQHIQVVFTPQVVGRVRAQIRLGKPSTTVYVNPQIIIT